MSVSVLLHVELSITESQLHGLVHGRHLPEAASSACVMGHSSAHLHSILPKPIPPPSVPMLGHQLLPPAGLYNPSLRTCPQLF